MSTLIENWIGQIADAAKSGRMLAIRGGGSKSFYGGPEQGERLDVRGHRGIVAYEPTELVVTARAGTPLVELAAALRLDGATWPLWTGEVELPAGSHLRWKAITLAADGSTRWEPGEDRRTIVPTGVARAEIRIDAR